MPDILISFDENRYQCVIRHAPNPYPPRTRLESAPLLRRSEFFCSFAYRWHDAPLAGRASAGGECPAHSGCF